MSNTSARAKLRAEQAKQRQRERRILIIVAGVIVLAIVAAGGGFLLWRANQTPTAAPGQATPTPLTVTDGQPITFGSSSAPAKISLFEDFHCPHCADFEEAYQPTLEQAIRENKAAVSIYPLAFIDQGSASAGNAFACAAQAGYGQTYFNGLFANHTLDWNDNQLLDLMTKVSGRPASATFEACVKQKQNAGWLQSISAVATQRNVSSTPTMFLDDAPVDIATLTPDALQAKIDQAAGS